MKNKIYSNRGMKLEKLIDATNKKYLELGFADVKKIPPPFKLTGYKGGKMTGFTVRGELVDYIGVRNGLTIIFDAKECKTRTSFPLNRIAEHQYKTLMSWWKQGAHAFILLYFSERGEHYMLDMGVLSTYWEKAEKGGRKSIPYDVIANQCEVLEKSESYPLHYLRVLE